MEAAAFEPVRFSTSALPKRDRLPFWRDFVGRAVTRLDMQPLSDAPLHAEVTLLALPGLRLASGNFPVPLRLTRTRALMADGDDALSFLIRQRGPGGYVVSQRGPEVALADGGAVGLLNDEPGTAIAPSGGVRWWSLTLARAALTALVGNLDQATMRHIAPDNEALRLLRNYLAIVGDDAATMSPEMRQAVAAHLHDLIALALGAARDGAAIATRRGLRAARLQAIKADILQRLGDPLLGIASVARRAGVTPRYVQLLFEAEGVTYSEFVLAQRLLHVHRMLLDPCRSGSSISALAYEAGFGDVPYFNHAFRRRFGAAPTDVRQKL
jgi:AraC-like DNA-binding protein